MRTKAERNQQARERYATWRLENPALIKKRKIGDKFGRLSIVKKLGPIPNKNSVWWLCRCECGNFTKVSSNNLGRGVKSCGCWRTNPPVNWRKRLRKYATQEEAAMNHLYQSYKYSATHRNLIFNLSFIQFIQLTKENCFYCNTPPKNNWKLYGCTGGFRGSYVFNGVDRKINNIGYTPENSVPCCGTCNLMKTDMSDTEFIEHAQKIAKQHHV